MNQPKRYLEFDNLPNRLTLFRILLIPFIIGILYTSENYSGTKLSLSLSWIAVLLFIFASFTDFLDGHIARKRNLVTIFGSFLDPIADKFLVISTLIILQYLERLSVIIVIILVLREVYMLSLRLLALHEKLIIPVNKLGRWKTAIQMVGIGFLMTGVQTTIFPFLNIGKACIYIACFVAVYSAYIYTQNLIKELYKRKGN